MLKAQLTVSEVKDDKKYLKNWLFEWKEFLSDYIIYLIIGIVMVCIVFVANVIM